MKILAFSTSNSKNSINKNLIRYAATRFKNSSVDIIDLNDYEMPLYNVDLEDTHGIPASAQNLWEKIGQYDAVLISHAEHNGSYTAVFKNTLDWLSRIGRDIFQQKKLVLLATSPGSGGASTVLDFAAKSSVFFGAELAASFSLPSYYDNFDESKNVISDAELDTKFLSVLATIDQ